MNFEQFDRVYCINLPAEEQRRKAIDEQFKSVGITNVQYVHVTPPPPNFQMSNMRRNAGGEFGVNLSQIKAVIHAIADGAKQPLFFEDDIVFAPNATKLITQAMTELPIDWGVLYLGGHPRGPVPRYKAEPCGDITYKIHRFSFAEGYSIRGDLLPKFVDFWEERITGSNAMYDFILGEFAGLNNGHAIYPLVTEQLVGQSIVANKLDDKCPITSRAWAAHIGDNKLTTKHRDALNAWKLENPGRWEQSLKRQSKK